MFHEKKGFVSQKDSSTWFHWELLTLRGGFTVYLREWMGDRQAFKQWIHSCARTLNTNQFSWKWSAMASLPSLTLGHSLPTAGLALSDLWAVSQLRWVHLGFFSTSRFTQLGRIKLNKQTDRHNTAIVNWWNICFVSIVLKFRGASTDLTGKVPIFRDSYGAPSSPL